MRKPNTSLRDDEAPLIRILQLPVSHIMLTRQRRITTNVPLTDRYCWPARLFLRHRMKERPDMQAVTLNLRCYDKSSHVKEHGSGDAPDLLQVNYFLCMKAIKFHYQ